MNAKEEDLEEIEEALLRIELVARKNKPMHSVTPAFHVAVARASHVASCNSLMVSAGEAIERENTGTGYRAAECESHRFLLDALRKRDPELARHEMEAHIAKTVDELAAIRERSY